MTMKKLASVSAFVLLILFVACDGEEAAQQVVLPSNLEITAIVTEGKGEVTVTATASNVNYFTFFFGAQPNDQGITSNDGTESFTYTSPGTYTVTVQAHATAAAFVSATKEIVITLPDPNAVKIPSEGLQSPNSYAGMTLVWQDEFPGTSLNMANWSYETGGTGWGNNELQFYRPDNTQVKDGYLIITAKREPFQGREFTSSRLITKDKRAFQYGRVDIRASLPRGQGMWPALWMLGSNFSTVGWPACGEIDIMEMIGGAGRERTVHGTVHWQNNGSHANFGRPYSLASGTFHDKFHVFSIVWDQNSIRWFVDNVQYNVVDITPAELSEFRNSFFFIFNIAVGGNWPGSPDATTTFPQHLIVDYVRVFQTN